jgi:hypothetical protein
MLTPIVYASVLVCLRPDARHGGRFERGSWGKSGESPALSRSGNVGNPARISTGSLNAFKLRYIPVRRV